jgi:hypothetical protein
MINKNLRFLATPFFCLTLFGIPSAAASNSPLDETIEILGKWGEVEKTLSEERSNWSLEEQSLKDTIAIYEQELAVLEEQITATEQTTSTADQQRADLLAEQDLLRTVESKLERTIIQQEDAMRRLIKVLPEPLSQEIRPLVQRMPEDSAKSSQAVSQRLQNIVGILTQVDKFNNSVEVVPEQRDFGDGRIVEVKTLYFGLAVALYADNIGAHAGVGSPQSEEGWAWEAKDSIAPEILDLIRMYEGRTPDIRFVPVPITIAD